MEYFKKYDKSEDGMLSEEEQAEFLKDLENETKEMSDELAKNEGNADYSNENE